MLGLLFNRPELRRQRDLLVERIPRAAVAAAGAAPARARGFVRVRPWLGSWGSPKDVMGTYNSDLRVHPF